MKNNLQIKTRYLKALVLTLVVGLFAFKGNAQTFNTVTVPAGPYYSGEELTVTYNASGFDAGTTFILWNDANFDNRINPGETVFGTSQAQGADEDIVFDLPDNTFRLRLGGFSGDTFLENTDNFAVQSSEITAVGTNDGGFFFDFDRASLRQMTTTAYDLSTTAPVRLDIFMNASNVDAGTNPIEVLYSTDGFVTAGTVLEDINTDTEFSTFNTFTFDLPSGAKTANTSFRIRQKGTVDYGTSQAWTVFTFDISIGDEFTLINPPGLGFDADLAINTPFIGYVDTQDETDASEFNYFPGDELNVLAELQNVDLGPKSFVAAVINPNTNEQYLLEGQTFTKDNVTKEIKVTGTVPTEINYNDGGGNWPVIIYPFEGTSARFGINEFVDFTAGLPDGFDLMGGVQNGDGLVFDQATDRSVTTPAFNITSTEGVVTFNIARKNDVISPAGNDIIVEYTTNGTDFTELTTLTLNDLPFEGDGFLQVDFDVWPTGVVSSSTQFRFRQLSNNGADLDAWILRDLSLQNASNIIAGGTINLGNTFINIDRPQITIDLIDVGGDGLAYPMEDYAFTYTIDEGAFPSGTGANAVLDRGATGTDADIIVGTIADIATGSITFTVPPIEAGDYTIYLQTANGENYFSAPLAIYNNELSIDNITFENPISIAGEEYGTPGEGITVDYSVLGTPGASAEIMLYVYDDNVGDYVLIGSSNDVNAGSITANLPIEIDYTTNPSLQLTLGNGGIYSNSPFDMTVYFDEFENTEYPDGLWASLEGTSNNFPSKPQSFTGSGVRSATTVPFDLPYGAYVVFEIDHDNNGTFPSSVDVRLEGSVDGTNWIQLDEQTVFDGDIVDLTSVIPNTIWSSNTQFRVIYNEDGAYVENEYVIKINNVSIEAPDFLESTGAFANFNLNRPTLSVNAFDDTNFVIGETVEVNYNAVGFAPGVEFAAVVTQGNEFYVVGTSATQGAGTISATMPVVLPLDEDNPLDQYDFEIVPYMPATAGDPLMIGETYTVNNEEDFLVIDGDRIPTNFDSFDMDRAGDREILTRAFDLSGSQSVYLNFSYNGPYGDFAPNANKNTIPRLQVSTDGGATFQEINVEDLAPGEMSMYDEGFLYEADFYSVEIPAEYITSATHFRWYQPLNLGVDENDWYVDGIELELNRGNDIASYVYENFNNPVFNINLNTPNLGDYNWVQSDLDDAVFNGESFVYTWDLADGIAAADADAFPAGTTFDFYLWDGGYVIDPDTGLPYVLGTTDVLGSAFDAEVPFYVVNGAYEVRLAASVDVDGEKYYFIGDEESGDDVGDLDVFLRVAQLEYLGDPNATIYAGQDVEFAISLENDETNLADNADIYSNIIFDGDIIVATQQGLGDITFPLPTDEAGNLDFEVMFSQGGPLGEVGDELMNGDLNNLDDDQENFLTDLPGLPEYMTYQVYESYMNYNTNAAIKFSMNFNRAASQNVVMEYSLNGGLWTNFATFSGNVNNYGSFLPSSMRNGNADNNRITFRWRLQNDIADGSDFQITNVQLYDANNGNNLWYSGAPGFYQSSDDQVVNMEGQGAGRRLITTRDFTADELAEATYLSYSVDFDQLPASLTADQFVVFEYSIDGGATYTEWTSYPEMDADMTLNGDMFTYALTEEMKAEGVRFRWRQEESKGYFELSNMDINFGETIPFDYYGDDIDVVRQTLQLTSISATEGCLDGDITVGYEIRGRFGADNVVTVEHKDEFGNIGDIEGYEFNLIEGTGEITFKMPSDVLLAGDDNESFRFRLSAYDATTDNDFTVSGTFNELRYELTAPIETDAEFSFNTPLACESEDVIVNVDDVQDYFMYEILNAAGDVLGELMYDPELGETEINIGVVTETTPLAMRITSMTSSGTTCNTLTSSFTDVVEVQQMHMLYSNNGGANNYWRLSEAGESVTVCNNSGASILQVRRLVADGSTTTGGTDLVEWFRDNLNNPVETGVTLQDTDVTESGAYFARVTTASCIYTTESVQVDVVETPDQPLISVTSGNLVDCSTADPVVLTAPADFDYYLWSTGETTRSIEVDDTRSVTVRVSNAPFGGGCGSTSSAPVEVDRNDLPDFGVRNLNTNEFIGNSEEIDVCEGFTVRFYDGNSWTNNGNITVVKDGADFATVESGDREFFIEESGVYSFVWSFNNLNVDCTISSNEFTVNVVEQPTASPTLTADGALTFCEGEGTVTLTAPTGFDYYRWRRNGGTISNPTQGLVNGNVLEVVSGGVYTVEVGNAVGCYSPESNAITITEVAEPVASTFNQISETCGSGTIDFDVRNNNGSAMTFQLMNGNTGLASGDPVTIPSNTNATITSGIVEEDLTPFYLEISYADGTGCTYANSENYREARIRNIVLELQGAQLVASYETSDVDEVRWYRNGVLLQNVGGSSITISDNAEYSIEVEYGSGCILTSSTADIGRVLANRSGVEMDVNTYPNPAVNEIAVNIASEYTGQHRIVITTLTGQLMKTQDFDKTSFESRESISINDLQPGMYNMQIQHKDLVKNIRIIKQ
ncbi:hypothetical protein GCM10027429_32110 [Marivirga atlantica]|jgi:hypothetical protein|uniref:T9SS type A sorting domain-containing protein n=1 Tax=Marivirga atlantica TaxID=1548457 RepID=A0A937DG37_9BACT|nr:T9SS type A sorting domain-containing protein [Marivirga atlantica]MBL0766787.1 T9SS type A sorting domain-containing protein [Marivirga atlantica]